MLLKTSGTGWPRDNGRRCHEREKYEEDARKSDAYIATEHLPLAEALTIMNKMAELDSTSSDLV